VVADHDGPWNARWGSVPVNVLEHCIEAGRTIGAGIIRILTGHVLINSASPVTTEARWSIFPAMLGEAARSFRGVSVPPQSPTWGGIAISIPGRVDQHPSWCRECRERGGLEHPGRRPSPLLDRRLRYSSCGAHTGSLGRHFPVKTCQARPVDLFWRGSGRRRPRDIQYVPVEVKTRCPSTSNLV